MSAQWWQSLEDLESPPPPRTGAEFAPAAAEPPGPDRREFLKLMGASAALATLTACGRVESEAIVPYAHGQPFIPGVPEYFASAVSIAGGAIGVIVRSNEGRPTKIEGNPDHPASLGATDAFTQAELLTLYDPDRSHAVRRGRGTRSEVSTWDLFRSEISPRIREHMQTKGKGLAFLTRDLCSPSIFGLLAELFKAMPEARRYRHVPLHDLGRQEAVGKLAGKPADLLLDLTKADVIVSLGSDFLNQPPTSVRYARDFAARRRVRAGQQTSMNRLYVAEPTLSLTGSNADHRLAVAPSRLVPLARYLAAALSRRGAVSALTAPANGEELSDTERRWAEAAADDLSAAGSKALVLAGPPAPPGLHMLAMALTNALGAIGTAAALIEPNDPSGYGSIEDLCSAIDSGEVRTLFMLDSNPAYDAPADLRFSELLDRVPCCVHMDLYQNETSLKSDWHLPRAHDLESWSDARGFDGAATIIQPLIAPLYKGRTIQELLAVLLNVAVPDPLELVRAYWRPISGAKTDADFERWWRKTLRTGVVAGTQAPRIEVRADAADLARALDELSIDLPARPLGSYELCFTPDSTVYDGRFANNAWLQELPKLITKLVWDNALLISPAAAKRLQLQNGQMVSISPVSPQNSGGEASGQGQDQQNRTSSAAIKAPVFIQPGLADNTVSLSLGYGRTHAGSVGDRRGVDAYPLRTMDRRWTRPVLLTATDEFYLLVTAQRHNKMEGTDLVRETTLEEYKHNPGATTEEERRTVHLSMYPRHQYSGTQWGMSIDTGMCNGCSACVIACQAENNIPVVGKDQVMHERAMHWIRVDRYYKGPPDSPKILFAPIPCMQCEDAPCELVCPVGATQHSEDGLNDMIYNRCIGTRYCSNNCPYKVRRFNFFRYADATTESLTLMRNPQVSVRGRGVMEKCTYCVQRIRAAEIAGRKENRPIRRGEVRTACQQVCPTNAIVFGDINDKGAHVALDKAQPQSYAMLAELNTHPRTTYLSAVRNRRPDLEVQG